MAKARPRGVSAWSGLGMFILLSSVSNPPISVTYNRDLFDCASTNLMDQTRTRAPVGSYIGRSEARAATRVPATSIS